MVIESDGMGELRVQQGDQLTLLAGGSGLLIDPILVIQLGDQMIGNMIAELAEDGEPALGCLRGRLCFLSLPCGMKCGQDAR